MIDSIKDLDGSDEVGEFIDNFITNITEAELVPSRDIVIFGLVASDGTAGCVMGRSQHCDGTDESKLEFLKATCIALKTTLRGYESELQKALSELN